MKKITKKLVGLLLVAALIVPQCAYAGTFKTTEGLNPYLPIPAGKTLTMNKLATKDGVWQKVDVKLGDYKLDNAGYLAIAKAQNFKEALQTAATEDHVKVKITMTAAGYQSKIKGQIGNNMPFVSVLGGTTAGEGGTATIFGGFEGSVYAKTTKYVKSGKTVAGEWVGKLTNTANFAKGFSISGYAYVAIPKGSLNQAVVGFEAYDENEALSFIAITNQALQPVMARVEKQAYGTDAVGHFDSTLSLVPVSLDQDLGEGQKADFYAAPSEEAAELSVVSMMMPVGSAEGAKLAIEMVNTQFSQKYSLNIQTEGNGWSGAQGYSTSLENDTENGLYTVFKFKVVGNSVVGIFVQALPREKAAADEIAASFVSHIDATATPAK